MFRAKIQAIIAREESKIGIIKPPRGSRYGSASYFRRNKQSHNKTRKSSRAYRVNRPTHVSVPFEGIFKHPKNETMQPGHNFIDEIAELRPEPFKPDDSGKVLEEYPIHAKLGIRPSRVVDF